MAEHIATSAVHHVRLTVTDTNRAREFLLACWVFKRWVNYPPACWPCQRCLAHNGTTLLVLSPPPERPISGDRFDPNRVGLDHLSLSVASRDDLSRQSVYLINGASSTDQSWSTRSPSTVPWTGRLARTHCPHEA